MGRAAIFGMFHRQIDGDEALLRLIGRRFEEMGIGAEVYPGSAEEALRTWQFLPATGRPQYVHLARHIDPLDPDGRAEILRFADSLRGRARGLVLHDRLGWERDFGVVVAALEPISACIARSDDTPRLFLEYAAGLELEHFIGLAERVAHLGGIRICIDTGHIGIFAVRKRFAERQPEIGFWELAEDGEAARRFLAHLLDAARQGVDDLVDTVERIGRLGRPLHFHLHDMHPLSLLSRWGVRDHLSFSEQVPVPPAVAESGTMPTLLRGPGLHRIIDTALRTLSLEDVTFTLEIHPTREQKREPLGTHSDLFRHWRDPTNAELTNGWMSILAQNAALLRNVLAARESPDRA